MLSPRRRGEGARSRTPKVGRKKSARPSSTSIDPKAAPGVNPHKHSKSPMPRISVSSAKESPKGSTKRGKLKKVHSRKSVPSQLDFDQSVRLAMSVLDEIEKHGDDHAMKEASIISKEFVAYVDGLEGVN